MAKIKIRVAGILPITFTDIYTYFMRGQDQVKYMTLSYTNGSGQILTAGDVLYSVGTVATEGYFNVSSTDTITLGASGSINLTVKAYPTQTVPDGIITFNYDGSPVVFNIDYRSIPVADNFVVEVGNRLVKTFSAGDFTGHFSDFDGDSLAEVMIEGDVTGYDYNGSPYVAGTWIAIGDIGLLTFTTVDSDTPYEKTNNWKAKDTDGYISNT